MYLMFVDESGTAPPPGKKHSRYFVIGGIILSEYLWYDIAQKFKILKKKYGVAGEVKWRFFSPHNKDNSLLGLNIEHKQQLRLDILQLITQYRSIKIISVIVDIVSLYQHRTSIQTSDELYQFTYTQLIERFQYYLQDTERETGVSSNGIVICDHREHKEDKKLRELHQQLLGGEGCMSPHYHLVNTKNLIEGVFLSPSHLTIGIQLADIVAGAIFRKYEKGDSSFFNVIEKSVRKSPQGEMEGYGIVISK